MRKGFLLACVLCLDPWTALRAEEAPPASAQPQSSPSAKEAREKKPKVDKQKELARFLDEAKAADGQLSQALGFLQQQKGAAMRYLNKGAGDVDNVLAEVRVSGPNGASRVPLLLQSDGKVSLLRSVSTPDGDKMMSVPLSEGMFKDRAPADVGRDLLSLTQGEPPEAASAVYPSVAVMMHKASMDMARERASVGQGRILGPMLSGAAEAGAAFVPEQTKERYAATLAKEGDAAARQVATFGLLYSSKRVQNGVRENLLETFDHPGTEVRDAVYTGMTSLTNRARGAVGLSPLEGAAVPAPAYTETGHPIGNRITQSLPHRVKVPDPDPD